MTELQKLALRHLRDEAHKAGWLYRQVANEHNFVDKVCTRDTKETEISGILSEIESWIEAILK
jgi:hypothetical protein